MRVKFISKLHPATIGYAYDTDRWASEDGMTDKHFTFCETYGDVHANGNYTQHSPDTTVSRELLTDYLLSLAAHLLDTQNRELADDFSRLCCGPSNKAIEFATTVKYKSEDSKGRYVTQWYSLSELKVSRSPAKSHDKRYEEVYSLLDGSLDSVHRILFQNFRSPFWTAIVMREAVRDWYIERMVNYQPLPVDSIGSPWNLDCDAHYLHQAYAFAKDIARAISDTARNKYNLEQTIRDLTGNQKEEAA